MENTYNTQPVGDRPSREEIIKALAGLLKKDRDKQLADDLMRYTDLVASSDAPLERDHYAFKMAVLAFEIGVLETLKFVRDSPKQP